MSPIPMRETQRRRLILKERDRSEVRLIPVIHGLFDKRFKVLKRELRRANLRKRLTKTDGLLFKDNDVNWGDWEELFTTSLEDALTMSVQDIYNLEAEYWMTRNLRAKPVDPSRIIDEYEARRGKQIKNIAEDTKKDVLDTVTQWYNSAAPLPDLIDELGNYFSDSRAEMIARTETAYVSSQVSRDMMGQFGITKWIWDLGDEIRQWPCQQCIDLANNSPYDLSAPMPPDPSHPNCRCGVLYATDTGQELMYGVSE